MASLGFGLTCLACLLLSLSMKRHYRQVFPDLSAFERRVVPLRVAGYGLLALAVWPCARELGLPIGLVLWVSMVALAAIAQIVLLTYRPRATGALGALGVALVAVGLLT